MADSLCSIAPATGMYFVRRFMSSDDEASSLLVSNLEGEGFADPRPDPLSQPGNGANLVAQCVALGVRVIAAGFMEPLESTSIHLMVQSGVGRLLNLLPRNLHQA